MIIYMLGKPRSRAELEAIAMHDEIIFIDTIEEYHEHQLTGKKPSMVILDEIEPASARRVIHVDHIGPPRYGKSLIKELMATLASLDVAAIEARVLAGSPDLVIDSMAYDLKTAIKNLPEPITAECTDDKRRRSKGEKRRNRRHRWSGQ